MIKNAINNAVLSKIHILAILSLILLLFSLTSALAIEYNYQTATANFSVEGEIGGSYFGDAVASGDINGDGYADIITGAYLMYPAGRTGVGAVYVTYGDAYTSGSSIDLNASGVSANITVYGNESNGYMSNTAVAAGDVNNDGYDDIIVGAYSADPPAGAAAGKVYVIYGSGDSSTQTLYLNETHANITIYGDNAGDFAGIAVASGDIDNDGYSDILVGANEADPSSRDDAGAMYVIYGDNFTERMVFDLGSANITILGDVNDTFVGGAITTGDINNDNFADIITGATIPPGDSATNNVARAFVFYGAAYASGTSFDLDSVSANITMEATTPVTSPNLALATGDVNNDNYADIVIGVIDSGNQLPSFVVYGGPTQSAQSLNLSAAVSDANITIYGNFSGSSGINSVATGDVNNDNFADIIFGTTTGRATNNQAGQVWVVYGEDVGTKTLNMSLDHIVSNITVYGGNYNNRLGSALASGDFDNDGYADVFMGAESFDGNQGRTQVLYGDVFTEPDNVNDSSWTSPSAINDSTSAWASSLSATIDDNHSSRTYYGSGTPEANVTVDMGSSQTITQGRILMMQDEYGNNSRVNLYVSNDSSFGSAIISGWKPTLGKWQFSPTFNIVARYVKWEFLEGGYYTPQPYIPDYDNAVMEIDMYVVDNDGDDDNLDDSIDPILGNETNVVSSGLASLSVTLDGNSVGGAHSGIKDLCFYEGGTLLMNFSHNFSASSINMSAISITLTGTGIFVNLSNQISINKSLYVPDTGLTSLCVKDAEIASLSEISASCTGTSETDFTSCLGNTGPTTINGIDCYDQGSLIRVDNLTHSGIRASGGASISGATILNEGQSSSFAESTAGSDPAQGANVTEINFSTTASTTKWQGYFGNVQGTLRMGSGNNILYNFGTLPVAQIVAVFASTDTNFEFASATAATAGNVDTVWGFTTSDADSGTNVFSDATGTISDVTAVPVANLTAHTNAGTLSTSIYQAGVVTDGGSISAGAYETLAFGVNVDENERDFSNSTVIDFELIVPVNTTGEGGTQSYFFFMDIR